MSERQTNSYDAKTCSRCIDGYYTGDGFWCELWGYYVPYPMTLRCDSFHLKEEKKR